MKRAVPLNPNPLLCRMTKRCFSPLRERTNALVPQRRFDDCRPFRAKQVLPDCGGYQRLSGPNRKNLRNNKTCSTNPSSQFVSMFFFYPSNHLPVRPFRLTEQQIRFFIHSHSSFAPANACAPMRSIPPHRRSSPYSLTQRFSVRRSGFARIGFRGRPRLIRQQQHVRPVVPARGIGASTVPRTVPPSRKAARLAAVISSATPGPFQAIATPPF